MIRPTSKPVDKDRLYLAMRIRESGNLQFNTDGKTIVSRDPKTNAIIAVGIGQVRPAVAKNMCAQLGIPYSKQRLFDDPAYNLRIGQAIFNQQWVQQKGDVSKVLAAYNWGPKNLADFMKVHPTDWKERLWDIPKQETAKYIQAVTANYADDAKIKQYTRPLQAARNPNLTVKVAAAPEHTQDGANLSFVKAAPAPQEEKSIASGAISVPQVAPSAIRDGDNPAPAPLDPEDAYEPPPGTTASLYERPPVDDQLPPEQFGPLSPEEEANKIHDPLEVMADWARSKFASLSAAAQSMGGDAVAPPTPQVVPTPPPIQSVPIDIRNRARAFVSQDQMGPSVTPAESAGPPAPAPAAASNEQAGPPAPAAASNEQAGPPTPVVQPSTEAMGPPTPAPTTAPNEQAGPPAPAPAAPAATASNEQAGPPAPESINQYPTPPPKSGNNLDFVKSEKVGPQPIDPPGTTTTDAAAVPGGVDPTPYYDSQGALQRGVVNNDGLLDLSLRKFKNNALESSSASYFQMWARDSMKREYDARGETPLSPDEANQKYPLPEKFTQPIQDGVARMMYGEFQRGEMEKAWDARTPKLGWALDAAIGFANFVGDPINLAAMGVGGPLVGAATGLSGLAAVVGENLLINVATESLRAMNRAQEHDPIPDEEIGASIALNTVFGTVFHYGLQYGGSVLAKIQSSKWGKAKVKENISRMRNAHESGQKFDMGLVAADHAKSEAGFAAPGFAEHVHETDPDLAGREFYLPISDGKAVPVGEDAGVGMTTVVDNPNAARNVGDVVRPVRVGENDLYIKLDNSSESSVFKALAAKLESKGVTVPKGAEDIRDLLALIPEKFRPSVIESAKELGAKGFQDVVLHNGQEVSNKLMVFDPEAMEHGPIKVSDPTKIYTPSKEELEMRQRESDSVDNMNLPKEPNNFPIPKPDKITDPTTSGLPDDLQVAVDRTRADIEEFAKTDPEFAKELAEIDRLDKVEKTQNEAAKKLTDCFGGML